MNGGRYQISSRLFSPEIQAPGWAGGTQSASTRVCEVHTTQRWHQTNAHGLRLGAPREACAPLCPRTGTRTPSPSRFQAIHHVSDSLLACSFQRSVRHAQFLATGLVVNRPQATLASDNRPCIHEHCAAFLRAACCNRMQRYTSAVEDCTHALSFSPMFGKALYRRAQVCACVSHVSWFA